MGYDRYLGNIKFVVVERAGGSLIDEEERWGETLRRKIEGGGD